MKVEVGPACVQGRVVDVDSVTAKIQTKIGVAYIDINFSPVRLQVGDELEIEEAGFYISDGRIFTVMPSDYILNGRQYLVIDLKEGRK